MANRSNENNIDQRVLPDNTVFYELEESERIIKNIEFKKYTLFDIILILFNSQKYTPINGRILLMKEIFLLIEEVFNKEDVQDAKYVPYKYGMYSFTVANEIANLEYSGYIKRIKEKRILDKFIITDKGMKYISHEYQSLSEDLKSEIESRRKGWDQLGYRGILKLVYSNYPSYIEKSELKNKYKGITWGHGVG